MSNKISTVSKTVATRSNKNISENNHQLPTTELPSGSLVCIHCKDNCNPNCNAFIKVIVDGHKRTSTMVSSNPTGHKVIEEKRKPGSSSDSHQSWGRVLREQNKTVMKQGLQRLMSRTPGSKSSKHGSETKETKKHSLNHQKSDYKHLDEIPSKQPASQKRVEEHIKSIPRITNPSSTSIPSTVESIIVYDKGIQCDGLFDFSDGRFSVFNPVRILSFLIKELEHLVKDDEASKILTDMEQVLLRLAMEPTKPLTVDLKAKTLHAKLSTTTTQIEERTRQMNLVHEALCEDRDFLQRQVQEQVLLLKKAQERQLDLETNIKSLKQELDEKVKIVQAKDKRITELTEDIKGYKCSQKVVAELRKNLAEQTELARQKHIEVQYLTLEKDKLSVLSTYKDSLLNEFRNATKELQNLITDQTNDLKDIYVHEVSSNPQRGLACSSPTSTSSHNSNIHTSWRDISDISLSTVDHDPPQKRSVENFLHKPDKISAFSETQIENLGKKRTKNIKESSTKDSANLDFVSLPGGESSLTLLPFKDFGCTEMSKSVNRGMGDVITSSNKKSDNLSNFKCTNKIPSLENLNLSFEKAYDKETDAKESLKNKRSLEPTKKQCFGKKSIVIEDAVNIPKDNLPQNLKSSTIIEQFQNKFQDIRIQSRMPINVPSPPRSYPHPEWSDSTLPSISTASDINAIHPNDT